MQRTGIQTPDAGVRIQFKNIFRHAVAQVVEALRYEPGVCAFDSQWCNWNFLIDIIRLVVSATNRNKDQEIILVNISARGVNAAGA
jgi:hypothetical protein